MNEADKSEHTFDTRFEKLWLIIMGNGVKGIIDRTQDLESGMEKVNEHHIREPQIIQQAVEDGLKKYYHGLPALIQSFGPWIAAGAAIFVALIKG